MSECLKPANYKAKSLVAKCGSVSSKFAYLMQTKEMMRNMLIQKGQDVPKDLPFRDYVEKIAVLTDLADAVSSIIDYTGTPHKGDVTVDKTFIGLSNVDNTADIDKPISTATQEALDLKQNITDDSLETEAKTIVGAINELDGEVATNTTNIGALQTTVGNAESGLVKDVADNTKAIGTLQTSLAGKQDATISVNIQGETKTTIPGALTSLDTALTAVKTTADGAAKVDASNIVPATWKGVLGYQSASDVSAAVIAGVTTNTYDDNLDTTNKTIVGAINEINTSNSGKQDSSITIDGITANTVEGALAELDTDISALQNKTQNINQASSGSTQFTGTVQADTFSGTTISGQTLTAGNQLTVNGSVTGSAIQTTLNASSTDQQLPSAKAVYDGLAAKQDATISVNIQGETKTTIPGALTSLDTALTAVKTTADGAAKVDASNIVPATWKGVLGYQSASDVSAAVIAGVTTNTYDDNLDTTNKTIVGAINEINTSNSGKQDSSITIDGITANTVEGALAELDTDISALQNKTQNINQASSGSTQFTGTVQADTFSGTTISGQTLTAGNQLTVNGSVTGSAIQTTLNASSTDQQLPSAKAVYDGLAAKQDALTYYEESTAGNGSVTIGTTTQAGTYPSAVTVASSTISVQLTTSTLNTIHANGGILNRETAFKSTSQTGSIGIAEFTNLAGCKVVFDTIASEGGAKSRTVFEYDATNNVWYREVIFGTGASITSMSGGTVNYDLGVAVSSANIVVSML